MLNSLVLLLVGRKFLELDLGIWISCSASCTPFGRIFEFLLTSLTNLNVRHRHHLCRYRCFDRGLSVDGFQIVSANLIWCMHSLRKGSFLGHVKEFVRGNLLFRFELFVGCFSLAYLVRIVERIELSCRMFVEHLHILTRILNIHFWKFDARRCWRIQVCTACILAKVSPEVEFVARSGAVEIIALIQIVSLLWCLVQRLVQIETYSWLIHLHQRCVALRRI